MKHITLAIYTVATLLFACNNEKQEGPAPGLDSTSLTKIKRAAPVPVDSTAVKFPTPGEFHKMLARSNGTWIGKATLQFSPDAPAIDGGSSILINAMAMDGLYQISEIKGTPSMGKPWTGLRITGYDNERKVFTRAMIGDGQSAGGVSMEGTWNEATKSITMPFKKFDLSTGKERNLKEVYKIIDENTEVLEIYAIDPKTKKEFKLLNVTWTRKK
jgi:hypothetical protein